jgi:hypothetical protein
MEYKMSDDERRVFASLVDACEKSNQAWWTGNSEGFSKEIAQMFPIPLTDAERTVALKLLKARYEHHDPVVWVIQPDDGAVGAYRGLQRATINANLGAGIAALTVADVASNNAYVTWLDAQILTIANVARAPNAAAGSFCFVVNLPVGIAMPEGLDAVKLTFYTTSIAAKAAMKTAFPHLLPNKHFAAVGGAGGGAVNTPAFDFFWKFYSLYAVSPSFLDSIY